MDAKEVIVPAPHKTGGLPHQGKAVSYSPLFPLNAVWSWNASQWIGRFHAPAIPGLNYSVRPGGVWIGLPGKCRPQLVTTNCVVLECRNPGGLTGYSGGQGG